MYDFWRLQAGMEEDPGGSDPWGKGSTRHVGRNPRVPSGVP